MGSYWSFGKSSTTGNWIVVVACVVDVLPRCASTPICIQQVHSYDSCEHFSCTDKYKDICRYCDDRVFRIPLQWCHNEGDGVSNRRRIDCVLNSLLRCRSKTSKLCVIGLCEGNSPATGPSQRASNEENVSIWWCHYAVDTEHRYVNDKMVKWAIGKFQNILLKRRGIY